MDHFLQKEIFKFSYFKLPCRIKQQISLNKDNLLAFDTHKKSFITRKNSKLRQSQNVCSFCLLLCKL